MLLSNNGSIFLLSTDIRYLLGAFPRTTGLGIGYRLPLRSLPHAGPIFEATGYAGPTIRTDRTERANHVLAQQSQTGNVSPSCLDPATLPTLSGSFQANGQMRQHVSHLCDA